LGIINQPRIYDEIAASLRDFGKELPVLCWVDSATSSDAVVQVKKPVLSSHGKELLVRYLRSTANTVDIDRPRCELWVRVEPETINTRWQEEALGANVFTYRLYALTVVKQYHIELVENAQELLVFSYLPNPEFVDKTHRKSAGLSPVKRSIDH
jgi:hypothetical protein